MRAGAFTETRVIELLNQRFVPFYFNTGGPGLGRDSAAEAFVKNKLKNPFAYLAAFSPDGEFLGETDMYADKDVVFEFLKKLLDKKPQFAKLTSDETEVLLSTNHTTPKALLKAAHLREILGEYSKAEPLYRKILSESISKTQQTEVFRALARIARYRKRWETLKTVLQDAIEKKVEDFEADAAMERAYSLLATKKYVEARKLLEKTIKKYPGTLRMGELRFYAGVCAFFQDDKNSAYYHWCWVVENIPEDRMQRRCYIAAAHEGMPYPNPELGGYKSNQRGGNTRIIKNAYNEARKIYQRIEDRSSKQ